METESIITNKTIHLFLKELGDIEKTNELEPKLNQIFDLLEKQPKKIQYKKMETKNWEKLSKRNFKLAQDIYYREINEELNFVWGINSFKAYTLLKTIVRMMNSGEFYPLFSVIRMFMEVSCSFYFCQKLCSSIVSDMNKNIHKYRSYLLYSGELENTILQHVRVSRIKSLIKESRTPVEHAETVYTYIDFVSKKPEYKDIRIFYDHLCEYTHPNLFSNEFFAVITKLYEEENGKSFKRDRISLFPGEADIYYLDKPEPWKSRMPFNYLGIVIRSLIMSIDIFTESLLGMKRLYAFKCTDTPREVLRFQKAAYK